jgi:hypothetical protein
VSTEPRLIVLQRGFPGAGAPSDLVLYAIDPSTGGLDWQWRYLGVDEGENLGMELVGEDGVVAAQVRGLGFPTATDASLLRFNQSTGLPVFHARYDTFNVPAGNLRFFDVAVQPDSQDIFVVGRIDIDDPAFPPGTKVFIGRFSSAGAPIWSRAYDVRISDEDDARSLRGVSIELTPDDRVAVTGQYDNQQIAGAALHMTVSQAAGTPINAVLIAPEGDGTLSPAYSSLELIGFDTLLISGFTRTPDQIARPAMWSVSTVGLTLNWFWAPDVAEGEGASAVLQPGRGPLLAGDVVPFSGPIGDLDDALLARVRPNGEGLCPKLPELRQIQGEILVVDIPLKPNGVPGPEEADLEVRSGDPVFDEPCATDCPADINNDGIVDVIDLNLLLACFNQPAICNPKADTNGDGFIDVIDLNALLAAFNTPCP